VSGAPKKVTRLAVRRAGSPWEGDIWMHRVSVREADLVAPFFERSELFFGRALGVR
jgi:hypothetical protein